MLKVIILLLIGQWLLSFFGQRIAPGIPHSGGFIYLLSLVIVILIAMSFLL